MTDKASASADDVPMAGRRCLQCGKPALYAYRPFCSKRCADLDLGKWFAEDYRVPSDEEPGDDRAEEDP
ncbi:DNA gyrase inhibitor YacG [Magnetospira sp. QH-2]|uniref:DNA gyrase inhibitor YacG n=1 Tax=Magnetospira sp. (strain QH-2) TaxID=1288970 RepID=UPI0003E81270|nr:DNA gyrase inhibitor YacG [Magnetospira sp. QH-2]CCQ74349.1 Conserved hypothetical protein [Magnetospira sp. QH-2]